MSKVIELTQNQVRVLQGVEEHLLNGTGSCIIYGGAGTGKTTVVKYLIQNLQSNPATAKMNIGVTAPTHKAKKEIEKRTGLSGLTIQSACGLRPDLSVENYNPKDLIFEQTAEPKIRDYKILIIDECSMINSELYKLIENLAANAGTKLIYIGDKLQLPPIKEQLSKSFNTKVKFELSEVVRQSLDNPLTKVLVQLRDDLTNSTNLAVQMILDNRYNFNGDEGYAVLDKPNFLDNMEHYYLDMFHQNITGYVQTLAWKNDTAGIYNSFIRGLLPVDQTQNYAKGDYLMGYKTVSIKEPDGEYVVKLTNSEDYVVTKSDIIVSEFSLKVNHIEMYDTITNVPTTVDLVLPESYEDYKKIYNSLLHRAKSTHKWGDYFRFDKSHQLGVTLDNTAGEHYKDKPDKLQKHLDYAYAMTVHKSQGSTFGNVFIDMDDILSGFDRIQKLKLLYVALSRTSSKAFIKSRN